MTHPFKVIWSYTAVETDLARHVLLAMDQAHPVAEINRAMHSIDRLLASSPERQGESRSGQERVLAVSPLSVVFEVYEDEHVVYISKVGYSPRRA